MATFSVLCTLCGVFSIAVEQTTASGSQLLELHRWYSDKVGNHYYTVHHSPKQNAQLAAWGYQYEGIAGRIFQLPEAGAVPLHRYFNEKINDHLYTTNFAELGGGRDGYAHEGIEGYVFSNPVPGTLPLYRYVNSKIKDHLYTTNWGEVGGGRGDWRFEKVEAYIFP